jgi:hypothetical protein
LGLPFSRSGCVSKGHQMKANKPEAGKPGSPKQKKQRFSPSEVRLLYLLPQDGTKVDTVELTKRFYADRAEVPEYARIAIGGLIRSIVAKTGNDPETGRPRTSFKVLRSKRQGPRPIQVWIEVPMLRPRVKRTTAEQARDKAKPKILDKPKVRQEIRREARRASRRAEA